MSSFALQFFGGFHGKGFKVCWQSWNGETTENLSLKILKNEISANGTIVSKGSDRFVAKYTIVCDPSWVTRKLNVEVERAAEKKTLKLEPLV